jgi:type IV pilus assembly protein PilM
MSRTIPNGGHMLTEALTNYFKISEEDAETGKAQLDFRELLTEEKPKENPPLRVLQPHVDDLVREIRRSLNYYQSQQAEGSQSSTVDALLLTGGGAKMNGLGSYLGHKLGIEMIELDVFENSRFLHAGEEGQKGSDLSVVTGLALRPYGKAA